MPVATIFAKANYLSVAKRSPSCIQAARRKILVGTTFGEKEQNFVFTVSFVPIK
jgi:hypothetical protein